MDGVAPENNSVLGTLEGKQRGVIDPEKGIWAPLLWRFLHTIIEISGGAILNGRQNSWLAADEARELYWILTHIETIIPCARCRTHCTEYKRMHPPQRSGGFIQQRSIIVGIEKEILRKWAWEFHTAVNERLGKPVEQQIALESVESTYRQYSIKDIWRVFWNELFPKVGVAGGLDPEKMREFNRHFQLWRGFSCLP